MDVQNSRSDVYVTLFVGLLRDDPLHLTTPKSLQRDVLTLEQRTRAEGISFLTKTLPTLGKAVLAGLENMRFYRPREFKRSHDSASRPAFMQAYLKRIFDESGNLLEMADPEAVKHVLQVCMFGYKLKLPYTAEQEARVIEGFCSTERELDLSLDEESTAISAAASIVARTVFDGFDYRSIIPKHGPGAVATGERLEEKWDFARLFDGIHQVYPYYDYFVVGKGRELIDRLAWYKGLERTPTGVARVLLVPKDSRGPRLISCEPLEYQWIQQGLGRKLVTHLEAHWLTGGQINFTHQEVNRSLALSASVDRAWATIDLKDASDRVSVELVKQIFRHEPGLLRALLGTRTTATALPDGRVIELKKFAPMGSALCFPVEAFVFYSLCVAAIARETGQRLAEAGKLVYVYGDDIIIPTEHAELCISTLERFALRVNRAKCCIQGYFRESCGMDAFKGVQITPTRLREPWHGSKTFSGPVYASWISMRNELARKGYGHTSDILVKLIVGRFGKVPWALTNSAFPGFECTDFVSVVRRNIEQAIPTRYNERYQRVEFLVRFLRVANEVSTLDDWPRLLRDLNQGVPIDPTTVDIPRTTLIKRGWRAA